MVTKIEQLKHLKLGKIINSEEAKRLLGLAGVGAASSIVTWLVAKSKFQKDFDEAVEEIREYYHDRERTVIEREVGPEETTESVVDFEEVVEQVAEEVLKDYASDTATNYSSSEAQDRAAFVKKKYAQIYNITEDEYLEDFEHQEKRSAIYYEADDVLVDDSGDIIEVHDKVVGDDFLEGAVFHKGERLAFVRNPILKIDYEISITDEHVAEFLR